MDYINPNYFELIQPLSKWKIMSLDRLLKRSEFKPKQENLYKIIKKMEFEGIIDSFIDPWSRMKHIYLTDKGASMMGVEAKQKIKRDSRFHDALMAKILERFKIDGHASEVYLDFEIEDQLSTYDHLPDALAIINRDQTRLAMELEINQKSSSRIENLFDYYQRSSHFDRVVFIFNRPTPVKAYRKILDGMNDDCQEKIMLLYEARLSLAYFSLWDSPAYHKRQRRLFKELFSNDIPRRFQPRSIDSPRRSGSFPTPRLSPC